MYDWNRLCRNRCDLFKDTSSAYAESPLRVNIKCILSSFQRLQLHTRRSSTQIYIYHMTYWYNEFTWWWTHSCPKHVKNRNKHKWKELYVKLVIYKDYTEMHGQHNIKFCSCSSFRYGRSVEDIVVISYSYNGLTSIKFSRERTLKRTVVIFAAVSQ